MISNGKLYTSAAKYGRLGLQSKTPFAFDQEATDLNRAYLKLKSMMMPYNYSIAMNQLMDYQWYGPWL